MNPEDKTKLYTKIFNTTFIILLILFLALYVSQSTGYYDYEQHKKVSLTEDKIKQFEKDVHDGKNIDIENYLESPVKNYQNKISQLGYKLSYNIGKYTKRGIKETFKFLGKMIDDN
ncbi:MAG: hypothetical protein WDA12_02380 [Bacilli bacterium]